MLRVKNFFLALISVGVVLLCAEGVFRVCAKPAPQPAAEQAVTWVEVPEKKWVDYHDVLGWYPQPDKTARLETPLIHQEIHTNAAGFRGERNYAENKNSGGPRILAVGDSFTFGFGVADSETFSRRLEERNPALEVLNAGVPGYGIDQVLMLYREIGRKYHPDVVLVDVFPEMGWRATRAFTAGGYAKPFFKLTAQGELELQNVPVPKPYAMTQGQFPNLFQHSFWQAVLKKSMLYQWIRARLLRLSRNVYLIDPDLSDEWKISRKILSQLLREIRKDGAEPVLVMIPPEYWVRSPEKNQPRRSMLRFAKREHVPVVDLTTAFYEAGKKSSVEDYYIRDDWHWTAKGHALAAAEIESFLKSPKRHFLPPPSGAAA
ncbi:MAG: hypothetical protein A2Z83_04610 [Omnitrophica bacterium GWA2_52_8]|nr:MAG: hypothetical protein A2Z83_04610 [Omnitrophica bacterium GWA2_52_8]